MIVQEFIDNFCRLCGSCCRDLTIQDRIELSFHFKKIILSKNCPYLTNKGCLIHATKPGVCKKWNCGVVKKLRELMPKVGEEK